MDTVTLVAVVIVVAVIAYAVYAANRASGERTAALKTLAPRLGLTFVGEFQGSSAAASTGDPRQAFDALRADFGNFRRFQGSMHPRVFNLMRGEEGDVAVSLFDYHEPDNQRSTANTTTLAWIDSPALNLPAFALVPIPGRTVLPVAQAAQAAITLVAAPRYTDTQVSLPAHPDFEDRYLLRGDDEAGLRRVFTDRIVSFLQDNPGWMIEGDGRRLLLNRLTADEVRTYWRGAVPSSEVREIAAGVSAARDGTLSRKLMAAPGVPPEDLQSFLSAALSVSALFRTA